MKVRLISKTTGVGELEGKGPQDIISFVARVSNPNNQMNFETAPKLLGYCIKHAHWSPFEQADLTFEIETTRAISAQILRHKSLNFQEFSLRYSKSIGYESYDARAQDVKNRQNSIDNIPECDKIWWKETQEAIWEQSYAQYEQALSKGIAKETARSILPLNTKTTIYMKGSVRSLIHYIQVRSDVSSQKEHRDIALEVKRIFKEELPDIAEALNW